MMKTRRLFQICNSGLKASLIAFSMFFSLQVFAEESAPTTKVQYIDIRPSFVTNFGGVKKKLKFAKVDVSIQVASIEDGNLLEQHFPLIRNAIVLLLSRQTAETMGNSSGQETIRQEAIKEVKKVLKKELGREVAEDLFFTNFVVQQ